MNAAEINLLILGLVSYPTLGALYWIFGKRGRVARSYFSKVLLGAITVVYVGIAILALLMGARFFSAMFVAYPLLYAAGFRNRIRAARIFSTRLALFFLPFFLLWFEELFAVLDYHGPVLQHFVFYLGFYVGIASVIYFFYRGLQFSFAQLFTIGGLWGLLIEGEFMFPEMFLQGIAGDTESLFALTLAAPFVFITYGLYLAGPFLLFYEEIAVNRPAGVRNVAALFVAAVTVPLLTWGIWTALLGWLGIELSRII